MKKYAISILISVLALLFIFFPVNPSGVVLRINYEEIAPGTCMLFYTTTDSEGYNNDQCIQSYMEEADSEAVFYIKSSLKGKITGLRLDFPHAAQVVKIKSVSLCSAGWIQKEINPCHFFKENELLFTNDIAKIENFDKKKVTHITTTLVDPYIGLSENDIRLVESNFSQRRFTRFLIAFIVVGSIFLAKRKMFSDN
ncbi:MAG: hypothetical protein MJ107_02970 [Lachnospiraceae bacterium]|nr:hypothetical protein [Lachnospiraceae bacterium]